MYLQQLREEAGVQAASWSLLPPGCTPRNKTHSKEDEDQGGRRMGQGSDEHLHEVGQQCPAKGWETSHDQPHGGDEGWRGPHHSLGDPYQQRNWNEVSNLENLDLNLQETWLNWLIDFYLIWLMVDFFSLSVGTTSIQRHECRWWTTCKLLSDSWRQRNWNTLQWVSLNSEISCKNHRVAPPMYVTLFF